MLSHVVYLLQVATILSAFVAVAVSPLRGPQFTNTQSGLGDGIVQKYIIEIIEVYIHLRSVWSLASSN